MEAEGAEERRVYQYMTYSPSGCDIPHQQPQPQQQQQLPAGGPQPQLVASIPRATLLSTTTAAAPAAAASNTSQPDDRNCIARDHAKSATKALTLMSKETKDILPTMSLSNRKILSKLRKAGKATCNSYIWASSYAPQYQSIPALASATKLSMSSDKSKKLAQILAEHDSEDERVVVMKYATPDDLDRVQHIRTHSSEQLVTKFTTIL